MGMTSLSGSLEQRLLEQTEDAPGADAWSNSNPDVHSRLATAKHGGGGPIHAHLVRWRGPVTPALRRRLRKRATRGSSGLVAGDRQYGRSL